MTLEINRRQFLCSASGGMAFSSLRMPVGGLVRLPEAVLPGLTFPSVPAEALSPTKLASLVADLVKRKQSWKDPFRVAHTIWGKLSSPDNTIKEEKDLRTQKAVGEVTNAYVSTLGALESDRQVLGDFFRNVELREVIEALPTIRPGFAYITAQDGSRFTIRTSLRNGLDVRIGHRRLNSTCFSGEHIGSTSVDSVLMDLYEGLHFTKLGREKLYKYAWSLRNSNGEAVVELLSAADTDLASTNLCEHTGYSTKNPNWHPTVADVRRSKAGQFHRDLVKLGYREAATSDSECGPDHDAVSRWQKALGVKFKFELGTQERPSVYTGMIEDLVRPPRRTMHLDLSGRFDRGQYLAWAINQHAALNGEPYNQRAASFKENATGSGNSIVSIAERLFRDKSYLTEVTQVYSSNLMWERAYWEADCDRLQQYRFESTTWRDRKYFGDSIDRIRAQRLALR